MTRKVHRHDILNIQAGLKYKQTLRARHHPRAHPAHTLPQEISSSSLSNSVAKTLARAIRYTKPSAGSDLHPGDDFYAYVNGEWEAHTKIPPYASSYGVSEEVEGVLQGILYREIQRCMRMAEIGREQTTPDGKACDAIGRLAMSAMRPHVQGKNVEYIRRGIRSVGCLREPADISRVLGSMGRYNIRSFLDVSVIPNEKNGYCVSLSPGELGLPAASYYTTSASTVGNESSILQGYTRLIQRACKALSIDDLSPAVAFEASLATSIYRTISADNRNGIVRLTELERRWPAFHWKDLFLSYGLQERECGRLAIYIDSEEWLDELAKHIETVPLETWYQVFALHILLHGIPYLPPPFDTFHFEFYGKALRGQVEKTPQKFLMLNLVKEKMSSALGRLFVKENLDPAQKTKATEFTKGIVDSAIDRMKTVEWMSPAARTAAAKKLEAMKLSVAWSSPLVANPPPIPSLQTDTLLANLYLLEAFQTDRKLRWLRIPPKRDEWEEAPYSVNAYYYHDTNELVIPAGSFMWPFMTDTSTAAATGTNRHHGIGWNYGGLGAVIGHEITHAFDREGKEFDPQGRTRAWWPASVVKAYEEKTKALIRLFSESKILGRHVNGTLTLDENLADLGGLAIALDALHKAIKDMSAEEKQKEMRDCFVAYAVSWRTKENPERQLQRLLLDKHAPVELRVNLVVSQFIPPEERIRIF
jgi:putative endopeptidase